MKLTFRYRRNRLSQVTSGLTLTFRYHEAGFILSELGYHGNLLWTANLLQVKVAFRIDLNPIKGSTHRAISCSGNNGVPFHRRPDWNRSANCKESVTMRSHHPGPIWSFTSRCVIRREREPTINPQPPDVVDPITLDYPTGRAVREAITELFQ